MRSCILKYAHRAMHLSQPRHFYSWLLQPHLLLSQHRNYQIVQHAQIQPSQTYTQSACECHHMTQGQHPDRLASSGLLSSTRMHDTLMHGQPTQRTIDVHCLSVLRLTIMLCCCGCANIAAANLAAQPSLLQHNRSLVLLLSEHSFAASYLPLAPFIILCCASEGTSKRLERSFHYMMAVLPC